MIDDMNVSEIPIIKYIIFHEISPLTARLRPVCNDINLTTQWVLKGVCVMTK